MKVVAGNESVEALLEEIAELVWQRQTLRARGAGSRTLERNRRRILRLQWELSYALIARHLPASKRAA